MGMDLYSSVEPMHANITAWELIHDALWVVRAPGLEQMSHLNEGYRVDASASDSWGRCLLAGLDGLGVVLIADRSFEGGFRKQFVSIGEVGASPLSPRDRWWLLCWALWFRKSGGFSQW